MDCASAKVYLQMEGGIKKNKVPQGLKMRKDGDSTQKMIEAAHRNAVTGG